MEGGLGRVWKLLCEALRLRYSKECIECSDVNEWLNLYSSDSVIVISEFSGNRMLPFVKALNP